MFTPLRTEELFVCILVRKITMAKSLTLVGREGRHRALKQIDSVLKLLKT